MKVKLTVLIFLIIVGSTYAQDSLRLTIKLDGFKEKDQLAMGFSEGTFRVPTEKEELTIVRKLDKPESMVIQYKSRVRSFWIDNNDIEVSISKSGFKKGFDVKGSPSNDLWKQIIRAPKEERAKLLEKNIGSPIAQSYLANSANNLLAKDKERLLEMSNSKTNDLAKYNLDLYVLDAQQKLKEGDRMIDFTASTIDGQNTSTVDYRGKYILLDFAGTGCGWCWVEYPHMIETIRKYDNLQTITINQDFFPERWQKIADSREINLPWPVLWKAENKKEIFANYGVQVLPTHYLISPEGIILARWQGAKENKLERVLEKYLTNLPSASEQKRPEKDD